MILPLPIKEAAGQNCCIFRPKEDHENEACYQGICAEIDAGDKVIPVQHCIYLGKAWVEKSPSWRTPVEDEEFFNIPFDIASDKLKIIAIH